MSISRIHPGMNPQQMQEKGKANLRLKNALDWNLARWMIEIGDFADEISAIRLPHKVRSWSGIHFYADDIPFYASDIDSSLRFSFDYYHNHFTPGLVNSSLTQETITMSSFFTVSSYSYSFKSTAQGCSF